MFHWHRKSEWGIGLMRGNLLILVISNIIWQFSVNIPGPYIPLYVITLGGNAEEVGLVNALAAVAGLILYPLGGYIADRSGRVKLVSMSTVIYATSFIPFAYAPNWQTLAAASFFRSVVLFYSPILTVIQADSVPAGRRSSAFALAISIPGALGVFSPVIGGYLVDTMGIRPAMTLLYMIGFGAGLFVAVLRTWGLTETLKVTDSTFAKSSTVSYRNFPKVLKESYLSFFETLRWMPRQIRILAVMGVIQIFFVGVASPFWILYAYQLLGLSATQWGLLNMTNGTLRILMAVPAGMYMDRHSRRRILLLCMIVTPMIPPLFLIAGGFTNLVLLVILMAFVNSFLMPGYQSLLADYTPRERRGRVTSAIGAGNFFLNISALGVGGGTLLFIPSAVALTLGGVLYTINPIVPFLVTAIGMAAMAVIAFFSVRDPRTLHE